MSAESTVSTESGRSSGLIRKRHRTVDRIAHMLEVVARSRDGMSLTEVAKELDAPLSSVQGLMNGLVATGYVDEYDRRYTLGTAPYLLNIIAGRHMVSQVQHQNLVELQEESGLTALLSIVVGSDVFYIDHSSVEARYAYLAERFVRRSLIRTSAGWTLLAGMPQRDLWSYLSSLGNDDSQRVEYFLAALPEIHETGVCASPHISDVADGVSIAVTQGGRTVAAVGVVGPPREIEHRRGELVSLLKAHAMRWQGE